MRSVIYILGWILMIEGVFMLLPVGTSLVYHESQGIAFLIVMTVCAVMGFLLIRQKPRNINFYMKEGFVCTALGWIEMSIFGCLPFVINKEIPSFINALFETVSGFTTTGASILPEVESMSHCSMVWRCFTHWIGGMGVLVFLLAVLPMVGGSNMQLMKAESPGPSVGKLVPKVRYTAQILYYIYFFLTAMEFLLLLCGGMTVFEALCTSLGTAGTGGFGFRNDSFGSFSPYIQWVVTVFMILFGVNFNVYFLLFVGNARDAFRCEEMRWYLGIILAAGLAITANIYDSALGLEHNLRNAFFQVGSIITTTGYSSVDFDLWPSFSKGILVVLMFMGACAGSTGGGLKVSRIIMSLKAMVAYLRSFLHPRAVRQIRFEGKKVEDSMIHAVLVYFFCAFFIVAVSLLFVLRDGFDMTTSFTAVAATFNNIGPGLSAVGPMMNYGALSPLTKLVLIFDMLAGRLEIFPMLMLLYPRLWQELHYETRRRRIQAEMAEEENRV